jgi:hypothetical protein
MAAGRKVLNGKVIVSGLEKEFGCTVNGKVMVSGLEREFVCTVKW